MKRRDVLAMFGVAGAGVAASQLASRGAEAHTVRGTCRLCVMECGVLGRVRGGVLESVDGDPASKTKGFACLHARAMPDVVHSRRRLRRPMIRRGDGFEEIDWQEAIGEIAKRLRSIRDRFGAEAFALQTGWPFVRNPLVPFLQRFLHAFGSPNLITVASVCESSGRMGKALTAGTNFWPDVHRARSLIVWGANPYVTSPPFARAVMAMSKAPRRLIVIDPLRTELARRAELHLQPRPGTDGALALGTINLVIERGLFDREFVAENTVGFEALAERARAFDLDRVAAISGVDRSQIERAVEIYTAHRPAAIWDGLGVEHHPGGVQAVRAIACLQAICGNAGVAGGVQLWQPRGPMETQKPVPPALKSAPLGAERFPIYELYNRQAQGNVLPGAILDGRLRALMMIGSNPLVTAPNTRQMREAFDALELAIAVDPFLTPTAERCHFVLPAATFAESGEPDVEPVFESWPDWKIVFELARALDLEAYFPWKSFEDALEAPVVPWMIDARHPVEDHRGKRFATRSGKIELYSETLAEHGFDPLPNWIAPEAQPTADHPLQLITGARTQAFINSQFREIEAVRRHGREPWAKIHPETAARAGVINGGRARITTPQGSIVLRAAHDPNLRPDVVSIPGGWSEANANELTDLETLDPISGFPALRGLVCSIAPA